jgi:hypothetical protein
MGKHKNKNKKKPQLSTTSVVPAAAAAAAAVVPATTSVVPVTTAVVPTTTAVPATTKVVPTRGLQSTIPFVSICTPTFNRRPFIPYMIKCFEHQDYPKDRMEWIIIDDGTDKIGDLVKHIPQVKYYSIDKKLLLGNKRNLMHEKTKGEFIVYMDDDDYYPPNRVSHAVETLQKNPNALCAGSSEIYIYFKHIQKMYQFGPYGPNHSTAGTFAFRRKLLNITRYDDTAALAEEKSFLKNYTIPFAQLEPLKTILVFSHEHNTFDKRRLLENINPLVVRESEKTVTMFVKEPELYDFYLNQIEVLLKTYEPGRPNMKPDVLLQMVAIEKERKKEMERQQHEQQQQIVVNIRQGDGPIQQLTLEQVMSIIQQQQSQIVHLSNLLQGKDTEIKVLTDTLQIMLQSRC